MIERVESQDVKNQGIDCWYECGEKDGPCLDFCGTDGYCCHQGWAYNGCDGVMGGTNSHRCVAKAEGKTDLSTT